MDTVRGYVEHITYRNEENGYTVLSLSDPAREKEGLESVFTAVGSLPEVGEGELLELEGTWTTHTVYGEQFRISSFEMKRPEETEAIERYLGSGIISGVRAALAHRIVKTFGRDTFRILDEEPERLAEIKGISKKKAREIAEQLYEKRDQRDALVFLAKYNISNTLALKTWRQYGPDIYTIIRENPYRLADEVRGIGFRTADEIAARSDIPLDSRFRVCSAILYVLENASTEGSLFLPRDVLAARTRSLLGLPGPDPEAPWNGEDIPVPEALKGADDPVTAGILDLSVEKKVILKTEDGEPEVRGKAVRAAAASGFEPDEYQLEALAGAQRGTLLILTGGPGTGKTTTINTMIRMFEEDGLRIELAAPTGRAAKRMKEATGREARTIHRLLEVSGDPDEVLYFNKDADDPLDTDVIIIDEMSMVDLYLFHALLSAVVPGTRLIMVGDADQLPSVGAGRVLGDLIASGQVPTVTLRRIFRQALQSDIVVNAHKINEGVHPVISNKSPDFFFLREKDPGTIIGTAIKLVRDNLPRYLNVPGSEIQVMAPMKKGVLGVANLNKVMQAYLNPAARGKEEHARGDTLFREGDRVMQVRNNYQIEWTQRGRHDAVLDMGQGVFNGDMGIIRRIDPLSETLSVAYDENRYVEYEFGELDQLELCYAVTIHKAQGSEYPAVVIPLLHGPRMLMNRNLLYTAVTRARRLVVLIGDPEEMNRMIDNTSEAKRYTSLDLYLKMEAEGAAAKAGAPAEDDPLAAGAFQPVWIDPNDPFATIE